MDESVGVPPGEPDPPSGEPDVAPVAHPTPPPADSSSSSLPHELSAPAPERTSSSPPPEYNPYPYDAQYELDRQLSEHEQEHFHRRQDNWMRDINRCIIDDIKLRVFMTVVNGVKARQLALTRAREEERLKRPPPPGPPPGGVSVAEMVGAVDFATADGTRGIPVRMLMASRRALHSGMQNPKWKCFAGWHRDTEWVRIRWPAYPQHVAPKSIVVSQRVRFKKPRRPVTRLELAVALAGVITEYYSEVTSLEPAPEYEHLALGSAEGRVSLYGLLMVCLRPAADGIFDLVLELIGDEDAMKPRIVRRIDVAELDNLIAVPDARLDSVPPPEAGPSIEGASEAMPAGPESTPVLKVERASTPALQ